MTEHNSDNPSGGTSSNGTPEGFDAEEEEWIKEQRARDSRRGSRSSSREEDSDGSVNINSLMDIMVIILVFLLKSFGDQPIKVTGEDLQVPKSTTKLNPEDMTAVTITRNAILVDDNKVVDVKDGSVDKSMKKGGEASMQITPLFEKLQDVVESRKREAEVLGEDFTPVVTVVADQTIPYRLVTEVVYTAGQAELSKYKFAVVRGKKENLAPAK
jgi:biopolymer transport protein ExbD